MFGGTVAFSGVKTRCESHTIQAIPFEPLASGLSSDPPLKVQLLVGRIEIPTKHKKRTGWLGTTNGLCKTVYNSRQGRVLLVSGRVTPRQ